MRKHVKLTEFSYSSRQGKVMTIILMDDSFWNVESSFVGMNFFIFLGFYEPMSS